MGTSSVKCLRPPRRVKSDEMPGRIEQVVLKLIERIRGGKIEQCRSSTPKWLNRPGQFECGPHWRLICRIYRELTDQELPESMPTREWRHLDGVLKTANASPQIIEVDELQHFNHYRAVTLRLYPPGIPLAFDRKAWIERSKAKIRLEGGGFAKPRPPLFPGNDGRHRQRAFRDALCDLLPPDYGFLPTLRIAYFEVEAWLMAKDALERMEELLHRKFLNQGTTLM